MVIRRFRPHPAGCGKTLLSAGILLLLPVLCSAAVSEEEATAPKTGRELYLAACAACHGADGRGQPQSMVGFDLPLPDFADSSFISREPREDWVAVSQLGGPVRRFSELMPSFKGVLTTDESRRIVSYIHSFNQDKSWPAGEHNLPRPLVTEKAFPEDEVVFSASGDLEGSGSIAGKFIYEKRLGSRNQLEVVIPYAWSERGAQDPVSGWHSGVGDIALALKRAFYHSLDRGTIFSAAAEFKLPTGDERRGFGKGTPVLEPFALFGQILPSDFFLQAQAGMEIPLNTDKAGTEAFLRAAFGRSFSAANWGRTFSPMVELLAARELEAGARTHWDIVPQMQVTLSRRQHIMMNFGVRLPLNDTSTRSTQFIVYLLWDWFDGGFFEGW
ncbi:MAG: c-type cytochrome [Candidatus Aminicenantes bacterium]|nr:c-type cytochrome [Candidatus Aminicenantes bacterium]